MFHLYYTLPDIRMDQIWIDLGLGTLFFPVECFPVVGPGLRLCQDPPERSSRRRISRKSALGAGDGQC